MKKSREKIQEISDWQMQALEDEDNKIFLENPNNLRFQLLLSIPSFKREVKRIRNYFELQSNPDLSIRERLQAKGGDIYEELSAANNTFQDQIKKLAKDFQLPKHYYNNCNTGVAAYILYSKTYVPNKNWEFTAPESHNFDEINLRIYDL